MKIAVIGAMGEEIAHLQERLENKRAKQKFPYTFYSGSIEKNDIIIVQSGIGKVAAALAFAALTYEYSDIALCINVGICGGVAGNINIGDIVIPEIVAYADVDLTVFSEYKYGQMANCPLYYKPHTALISGLCLPPYFSGTILSGDSFYACAKKIRDVIHLHCPGLNVVGFDMETAALAQCAYVFNIPFLAIRTISDIICACHQVSDYNKNKEKTATAANALLFEILKNIG